MKGRSTSRCSTRPDRSVGSPASYPKVTKRSKESFAQADTTRHRQSESRG